MADTTLDLPKHLTGDIRFSGFEDQTTRSLAQAHEVLRRSKYVTLQPILPLLLQLKGEPYNLRQHFPFESFFMTRLPRRNLLKTGRQVSKSTSLAARSVVQSACTPYLSTLCIAPLYETIRRFSNNYVRPFIEQSPIHRLLTGTTTVQSVLQRTFKNYAQMFFSFAFLDAERVRGIAADQVMYDEIQNLDIDFIPIIAEVLSGSKLGGLQAFAGTPKTMDNTIEALWNESSQAEWIIKCHHAGCGYYNVPALSHDLDDMTGPLRDDISWERPAIVCAKCKQFVLPQNGRWVHRHPERQLSFAGRHVPQQIMPMHFADPEKWEVLLGKRSGAGNTPIHVYYNEVCGESYDTGARLVTVEDLKKAALLPWKNLRKEAIKRISDYHHRILAIDWGGGGETETSFTTYAVMGMMPDGKIDVIWGLRSTTPHDHPREAEIALGIVRDFGCQVITHDYTGAGSLRETFIVQSGFPLQRIVPVVYVRAASFNIMQFQPATVRHPRNYYKVDKTRSLLLTCNQLKVGWLRFFEYDYMNSDNPGLLQDFLSLTEDRVRTRMSGSEVYLIVRDPNKSDDFAQAVNIGCCCLWRITGKWPMIAEIMSLKLDSATQHAVSPAEENAWTDIDL